MDRQEKLEAFRELTEGVDAENPENNEIIADALQQVYGAEVFGSALSAHVATFNESEIAELLKTPSFQPKVK
jgi:acyl-CoA thioesterase